MLVLSSRGLKPRPSLTDLQWETKVTALRLDIPLSNSQTSSKALSRGIFFCLFSASSRLFSSFRRVLFCVRLGPVHCYAVSLRGPHEGEVPGALQRYVLIQHRPFRFAVPCLTNPLSCLHTPRSSYPSPGCVRGPVPPLESPVRVPHREGSGLQGRVRQVR
jgi:hypothetical protein